MTYAPYACLATNGRKLMSGTEQLILEARFVTSLISSN